MYLHIYLFMYLSVHLSIYLSASGIFEDGGELQLRQSSQILGGLWGTSGTLRRFVHRLADCPRRRVHWMAVSGCFWSQLMGWK